MNKKVSGIYPSTEFWVTVATNVGTLASTIAGALPPHYAAIVLGVVNSVYALSRGIAKANPQ